MIGTINIRVFHKKKEDVQENECQLLECFLNTLNLKEHVLVLETEKYVILKCQTLRQVAIIPNCKLFGFSVVVD